MTVGIRARTWHSTIGSFCSRAGLSSFAEASADDDEGSLVFAASAEDWLVNSMPPFGGGPSMVGVRIGGTSTFVPVCCRVRSFKS